MSRKIIFTGLAAYFLSSFTAISYHSRENVLRDCENYRLVEDPECIRIELKDKEPYKVSKILYNFFNKNMDEEDWQITEKIESVDLERYLDLADIDKDREIGIYDAISINLNPKTKSKLKNLVNSYFPARIR